MKGKIIGTKSNKDPPYKNHRNGGHRGLLQKKFLIILLCPTKKRYFCIILKKVYQYEKQ